MIAIDLSDITKKSEEKIMDNICKPILKKVENNFIENAERNKTLYRYGCLLMKKEYLESLFLHNKMYFGPLEKYKNQGDEMISEDIKTELSLTAEKMNEKIGKKFYICCLTTRNKSFKHLEKFGGKFGYVIEYKFQGKNEWVKKVKYSDKRKRELSEKLIGVGRKINDVRRIDCVSFKRFTKDYFESFYEFLVTKGDNNSWEDEYRIINATNFYVKKPEKVFFEKSCVMLNNFWITIAYLEKNNVPWEFL